MSAPEEQSDSRMCISSSVCMSIFSSLDEGCNCKIPENLKRLKSSVRLVQQASASQALALLSEHPSPGNVAYNTAAAACRSGPPQDAPSSQL